MYRQGYIRPSCYTVPSIIFLSFVIARHSTIPSIGETISVTIKRELQFGSPRRHWCADIGDARGRPPIGRRRVGIFKVSKLGVMFGLLSEFGKAGSLFIMSVANLRTERQTTRSVRCTYLNVIGILKYDTAILVVRSCIVAEKSDIVPKFTQA